MKRIGVIVIGLLFASLIGAIAIQEYRQVRNEYAVAIITSAGDSITSTAVGPSRALKNKHNSLSGGSPVLTVVMPTALVGDSVRLEAKLDNDEVWESPWGIVDSPPFTEVRFRDGHGYVLLVEPFDSVRFVAYAPQTGAPDSIFVLFK